MYLYEQPKFMDYVNVELDRNLIIRAHVSDGKAFEACIYCRVVMGDKTLLGYLFLDWTRDCSDWPTHKFKVLYENGLLPHMISDMEFRYHAPDGWEAKELNVVTVSEGKQPVHFPMLSKRYLHEILSFVCGVVYGMTLKGRLKNAEEEEWLKSVYRRLCGAINSIVV